MTFTKPKFIRNDNLFILILIPVICIPVLLRPEIFLHDDSFFYMQIAYNIATGHGSTFHQITATNGYHPLWMLFCIASMKIAGCNKLLALSVMIGIQICFLLGMLILVQSICRKWHLYERVPSVIVICLFFTSCTVWGSEAFINGFFTIVCIRYAISAKVSTLKGAILLGLAQGACFLARLDNIFFRGMFEPCNRAYTDEGYPAKNHMARN